MKGMILALALVLGGCAGTLSVPNPVGTSQLGDIESAYGLALTAALTYRNLPLCKTGTTISVTNVCARRSVVVQLQSAAAKAQAAVKALRAFVAANPTLNPGTLVAAAQAALATLQSVESANGVQ